MNRQLQFNRRGGLLFCLWLLLLSTAEQACSAAVSAPVSPDLSAGFSAQQNQPQVEVVIDRKTYSVPSPWTGNKIVAPEFDYEDFRQIPVEYTYLSSKVYILESVHNPLVEMLQAAAEDGIELKVESAYRSERYQQRIFKRMLAEGRTFADIVRYVAPPGYSQHVLGTAVDFYPSNWRFAATPDYAWLQTNAHKYGFGETYSRTNRMKMPWEAWHWNYTGSEVEHLILPHLAPDGRKKLPAGLSE